MSLNAKILEKLNQARKSLDEAEKLLTELAEEESTKKQEEGRGNGKKAQERPRGIFDGQFLVTPDGKKYQVPPNYASKTMLVVGDELELLELAGESKGGQNKVKPVRRVARVETEGILTKKDNRWAVVTDGGIYWVLSAAVEHYKGEIGDRVKLVLPKNYKESKQVNWAALKAVIKDAPEQKSGDEGARQEAGGDEDGGGEKGSEKGSLRGEIVLENASVSGVEGGEKEAEVEELR